MQHTAPGDPALAAQSLVEDLRKLGKESLVLKFSLPRRSATAIIYEPGQRYEHYQSVGRELDCMKGLERLLRFFLKRFRGPLLRATVKFNLRRGLHGTVEINVVPLFWFPQSQRFDLSDFFTVLEGGLR